ncbi:Endonuclease 4 [Buchnera aphidicola (Cinara kochiana kochiana)]|uniref:Probable endonuclease 4 n=1 Tax=Buchnera aphidicola (Cinara kochiana kochiana) TaxID=2518976 RepID=A0A451D5C5_9GAMM|nr:deoxyribonuclease IV [Buchnera aphidicola]VFP81012.1 Endonuclease 4 [Buchnera aphidicola (Cinara kochiana kochiana)]
MKYIGAHVSAQGGLDKSVLRAHQLNATAFSLFLNNPLRWNHPPLTKNIINDFRKNCKIYCYSPLQILPHSSFLINLGHPNQEMNKKSCYAFIHEINCCYKLGLTMINIHPGSYLYKITEKKCLEIISNSINFVLSKTRKIVIVLENTAGQGSNLGYCFEHFAFIINKIEDKSRIGICLDICHLFASGYQLNDFSAFQETFKKFNAVIGLQYLCGIHINDSKGRCNSRLDRHHNLGYGKIKKHVFSQIVQITEFQNIPIILETKDTKMWKNEIFWLKQQSLLCQRSIFKQ